MGIGAVSVAGAGGRGSGTVRAELVDAWGNEHGKVTFKKSGDHTEVRVRLDSAPEGIAGNTFHGFHVHANTDPANGEGCAADPDREPSTWFVAVDGHWKSGDQAHAAHVGDMPSLLLTDDGTTEQRFLTDRIDLGELRGKAVIMHAGADNFGNIPLGAAGNQYTANSPDATTLTANTGNAGNRVLCGELR